MKNYRLLLLFFLLHIFVLSGHAQFHLTGTCVDSDTSEPLYDVRLSLYSPDSVMIMSPVISRQQYVLRNGKHHARSFFQFNLAKPTTSYLIRAQKPGYKTLWQKVVLKGGNNEYEEIPTLKLQMNDPMLVHAKPIEVKGTVEDAFLQKPVPAVNIALTDLDSNLVCNPVVTKSDLYRVFGDESPSSEREVFSLQVPALPQSYYIHAYREGYGDVWQKITVKDTANKVMEIPTIKMRKVNSRSLGEAVVTATRVKMYYKGDTIVYDALAFNMPEGSLLEDLINQLPGVTMNNSGEIFVNGRKVNELLLSSRSFMNGDKKVLLENLPYYAVKDIKVYDRTSDKSVALGYDVDAKDYVMDVRLKKEYNRGYIANLEGAAGTEKRWLGRAFGLFFTERMRVSLVGNLNNLSESRHIGQYGFWTPGSTPNSLKVTRSGKGEIAYFSEDNKVTNSFNAEYTSTSDCQQMRQRREQIMTGRKPTSLNASVNNTDEQHLWLRNNFKFLRNFYLNTHLEFTYDTRNSSSNADFQQWDDSLTASNSSRGFGKSRNWMATLNTNGAFNMGRKQKFIDFVLSVNYIQSKVQNANSYITQYFVNPSINKSYNTNDCYYRTLWGNFELKHKVVFSPLVSLDLSNNLSFYNGKSHDYMYHPDSLMLPSKAESLLATFDSKNSYNDHKKNVQDALNARLTVKRQTHRESYDAFIAGFNMPVLKEELDYQRGQIDTLARATTLYCNPYASFMYYWKDMRNRVSFDASYTASSPDLDDKINYRDDSNPLVVQLGNPEIHGRAYSKLQVNYRFTNFLGHEFRAGTSFNYGHRDIAQSTSYNPQSGVYTYQPMNVCGAYEASGGLGYSLEKPESSWRFRVGSNVRYHHSVDHAMLSGETASHRNVVNTWTQGNNIYLRYGKKGFEVSLQGDMTWRRSTGQMRDFTTLNVFDYKYGLNVFYTIPRLKTTLRADATMYSRRGYASQSLNTDDFVMNASISQPFFKGRLLINIEAYDILHQLSSTTYEVNAQGRTETWYRTLPNYVMLHIVYRWSKNPKKL